MIRDGKGFIIHILPGAATLLQQNRTPNDNVFPFVDDAGSPGLRITNDQAATIRGLVSRTVALNRRILSADRALPWSAILEARDELLRSAANMPPNVRRVLTAVTKL